MFDEDPFAEFVRPPLNETPSEKAFRKSREAEEKRVSDAIDEELKQEKHALQKQKSLVKVLLLGQSESGKSTTLKNFRLAYARAEWEAEKTSWRAVIQLNLIRSVTCILDALQAELDGEPLSSPAELEEVDFPSETRKTRGSIDILSASNDPGNLNEISPQSPSAQSAFSASELHQLQLIRLRLAPLRRVEADLKQRLGAATEEVTSMDDTSSTFSDSRLPTQNDAGYESSPLSLEGPESKYVARIRKTRRRRVQGEEIVVRGLRWREFLSYGRRRSISGRTRASVELERQEAADGDTTEVIAGCREDMKMLWSNESVRKMLRRRRIEMENAAGFFLDDIDRIATRSYLPSDDDVVRSRLRTLGVQEYRITVPIAAPSSPMLANPGRTHEWIIYDVGGSRTMRRAWVPYFEDVNAIIFLAPVSGFDEVLLEDASVNRLNDSVALWKGIMCSKVLRNTTMVCFLNKCDLLKRKLRSGIQFRHHVRDFGNQENDITTVVRFIKDRFKSIAIKYSIEQRTSYIYTTSVTDTAATAVTLQTVRDSILRENLTSANLV